MLRRHRWFLLTAFLLAVGTLLAFFRLHRQIDQAAADDVLTWVEFDVTEAALSDAYEIDLISHDTDTPIDWVDLLAILGAKYGGDFSRYRQRDLEALAERIKGGETIEAITAEMQYFPYYKRAYGAVLDGMVGEYQIQTEESWEAGTLSFISKYGLKAYSPIAYGYSFSHYDDFGNSRSYGYRRRHLGNDLLGQIGTPVIAVESGIVEVAGWNQYGGWRVGIRSFDGLRYYYYAHLRKNRPFREGLTVGSVIEAGDIVGYLGMTGYSTKENVNGMTVPHLHFGMQLVFEESQKESNSEIWIDVYALVSFLEHHKSPVIRNDETKEYYRKYEFIDPAVQELDGVLPRFPGEETGKDSG
jgi:murein DD-endopeptidase MepM/ murein hydrolase activator NlpD